MNHPSEDRLVLFHYEGDRAVAGHVASCPDCRGRLGALRGLLELVERAPVPEREESYGRQVWNRVAPRLTRRPPPAWGRLFSPLRLALAAGLAALVAAAFLAGRFAGLGERPAPSLGEVRERVLVVALGEHLERSQAVLLEFVHAAAGRDASGERARAQELVGANRLYRQASRETARPRTCSTISSASCSRSRTALLRPRRPRRRRRRPGRSPKTFSSRSRSFAPGCRSGESETPPCPPPKGSGHDG